MNNKEMEKAAVKAGVFGVLAIAIMLQRAATKHIVITDAAVTYKDRGSAASSFNILIDKNAGKDQSGKLTIPLSKTVSSDDIVLEDRYMDHELRIYIDSREEDFYRENAVITDLDILESAVCTEENDSGSVCLDFKLDGFYASSSSLTESSTIEIEFCKPSEMYDHIVVVDTSDDVIDGDSTCTSIAMALKELSAKDSTNNIKIFFTKLGSEQVDIEKRCALVKDAEADLVIGLDGTEISSGEKRVVTAFYNDQFFLRELNNAAFSDIVERNVAISLGAEAQGVFPVGEEDLVLLEACVPATRISVKCMAETEEYKMVAQGIYEAVIEAFERLK